MPPFGMSGHHTSLCTVLLRSSLPKPVHNDRARSLWCCSAELAAKGLALSHALFVKLYLSDMSHFAAANAAYCRHFPAVSPAARACVQVGLPEDRPVMLDVLLPASQAGDQM